MEEPVRSLLSHQSWLRRLARRLVRSPAAADDLVQDTCVTALRVAPPGADMRPWLRGVMRHLASHYVRGERRRIAREDSYQRITSSIAAPDGILEYGVDRERLRDIVESLPEPFRSTVVQRYIEGLSCAEIARAHRVPAGTVRWRQTRALELLRSRLEDGAPTTGRRRRLFWPFAGAGSSLSSGRSLLPVPGRGSLVALGLAGLVAIIGLGLRTGADDSVAEAHPVSDTFLGRLSLVATTELGAGPDRSGAGGPEASTRAGRGAAAWSSTGDARRRRRAAPLATDDSWLAQLIEDYELALYDCAIERDQVLHCEREPIPPGAAGAATCSVLQRSLSAIELATGPGARSRHTRRFLAAARFTNLALSRKLGCAPAPDRGQEPSPERPAAGSADVADDAEAEPAAEPEPDDDGAEIDEGESDPDGEPSCESHRGEAGDECTTCTDGGGSDTFCGPVNCTTTTEQDGAVCTSCSDGHGHAQTSCTGGTWESGCELTVQEHGLLCSACPGDGGSPPECLVSNCYVRNRCLECRDPKGRIGTDCSIDYEEVPAESTTVGGGGTFNVCSAHWGFPGGSGGTCHFPGTGTCTFSERGGARCIDCRYPGGGDTGTCLLDPSDPLPDPMAGRPGNLPPPGGCVTETRGDGIQCTTCTAGDMRATMSCRFPPASGCEIDHGTHPGERCVSCTLVGGGLATFCDGAGT